MMSDAERLPVLLKGLVVYREKYIHAAYMIAKNAAGLAGMNDQIPDYDDLLRSRLYFEEMKLAVAEARNGQSLPE